MSLQPTTAWLWRTDQGLNGLNIDAESGRFRWYDDIGCACDESFAEQSWVEFQQSGPPAGISIIPEDIQAEVATTVDWLNSRKSA